jgi:putative ABC transport system permease protein
MWSIATSGARAHRGALAGTALVLAAAGALLSMIGVLMESGLRAGTSATSTTDGGALTTLASSFAGTALVVVMIVVAATVSLVLRGRRREFALLRTVGATHRQVRRLISLEVLLVALVAVPLGAVPGLLLARLLDPALVDAGVVAAGFTPSLSPLPVLAAIALLVPTALLAGRIAARETVRISPTEAVRQSAVEASQLGRTRRVAAAVIALAGLATAFTPLVVPGTIGSASAATSAFLLIGAVALAGPLLVAWTFDHTARLRRPSTGAASQLALANVRGFSRRLTTIIVPLALVVATGTIQTSVDRAISGAATHQLDAAIGADLVVTADKLSSDQVASLAAVPGVTRVTEMADVPAQVRTDEDDLPDSMVWESAALRVIPADVPAATFDPDVVHGSLAGLDRPDTVAISSDAAFEIGLGTGDSLDLRYGGAEHRARVVAVYDRGLGVGSYLVGAQTLAAHDVEAAPSTVLVDTTGGAEATAAASDRIDALGLSVTTTEEYVASATSADAADQHLSTLLLLLLLIFVGLGAANTLVLTTAGRRGELALLHRTGTTRRQLLTMTAVESLLTGLAAWVIGTLAVVPAVFGVTFGLLGPGLPSVDLATYGVLSGAVIALAMGATLATAARTVRSATSPTSPTSTVRTGG